MFLHKFDIKPSAMMALMYEFVLFQTQIHLHYLRELIQLTDCLHVDLLKVA